MIPSLTLPPPDRQFIEFFSGVGLVHEALSPLGWSAVLANDICAKKNATYSANFPNVLLTDEDVRTLDLSSQFQPRVRLATASFPCIDISQAGGRLGIEGPKSSVVWAFLDRIAELDAAGNRPEFLFLENVPGLLYLHEGRDIDLLLRRISELGYAVDVVQVDARYFTPQTRNRVFIMGVCRSVGIPTFTGIRAPIAHIRRYRAAQVYERNPDLPWIFFDFPPLPDLSIKLADIVERLPTNDPRWWTEDQMDYFWKRLEHTHRPKLEALAASKKSVVLTAVRRGRRRGVREQIINVRWDGLASCVRTPKGGSSTQFIVQIDRGVTRVRRLLAIEAARLQGLNLEDAAFALPDGESDGLFAMGDAVCVPAVRWVFENSIQQLVETGSVSAPAQQHLPMAVNG